VIIVAGWIAANLNLIPGVRAFDPFPFGILALFVSSESVFLTIFVLISQNRMSRQAERRAHLDLQVKKFNGNAGAFDTSQKAVYQDKMQSFTTTEPAIDLTSTSFLRWSWRLAKHPGF